MAETWAEAATPQKAGEAREWLAVAYWRPAFFYLRRHGYDGDAALALAKAAFERAPVAPRLRETLLKTVEEIPADAEPAAPLVADYAGAEADLRHFDEDPAVAFRQGWASELVRRALGLFYADCQRDGRDDLYEMLHRRLGWGSTAPDGGRVERRARSRFREILRRTVAGVLASPGDVDDELRAVADTLPAGAVPCSQCGARFDPAAIAQVYAEFCPRCLLQIAVDPAPPLEQLGAYEIVAHLGRDEHGELFRARQEGGAEVALRLLDEPEDAERARAVIALKHPAIAGVFDVGTADGRAFMAFELVDGPTLDEAVPADGFPWGKAAEIVRAIAEGVARAHDLGLVHGALDASKIFLDRSGRPHVTEFGFAQDTPDARASDVAALQTILERCAGSAGARSLRAASAREFAARLGPPKAAPSEKAAAAEKPAAVEVRGGGGALKAIAAIVVVLAAAVAAVAYKVRRDASEPPPPSPPTPPPVKIDDPHERALRGLAEARAKGDRAAVEAFVHDWPKDPEGHWVLARAAFARMALDEAGAHARRAIEQDATAAPAWRVVGFIEMERERPAEARAALEKVEGGTWRLPRTPQDEADELLAAALLAWIKGEPDRAIGALEEADKRCPGAEICRWSGVVLAVLADPAVCARWQTRALELRPDYVPALLERGMAYLKLRKWEGAVGDFTRVLELAPGTFRALLNRGIAQAELDWLEPAEKDLSDAIALDPAASPAWMTRAQVRRRLDRWAGALEDATEAARLEPKLPEAHLERGRALWKLNRREEAELAFEQARMLNPKLKGEIDRIRLEK